MLAEELEPEKHKIFVQPLLEGRSALEHICRAMSVENGLIEDTDADYAKKNFDKAIGHLYRAFFDIADWLGVTIREKLIDLVEPYDNECIVAVAPEYYPEIKSKIELMAKNIAGIREKKDIGNSHNLISQVEEYVWEIDSILELHNSLVAKIPAMEEYKSKQDAETAKEGSKNRKQMAIGALIGIVVTVVGGLILWYFTRPS